MNDYTDTKDESSESTNDIVENICKKIRRHYLASFYLYFIPILMLLFITQDLVGVSLKSNLIVLFVVSGTSFYWFFRSKKYLSVTHLNVLEHINRHFSAYQESAQLLSLTDSQLTNIQQLQKQRVLRLLKDDYQSNKFSDLLPEKSLSIPILITILSFVLFFFAEEIKRFNIDNRLSTNAIYQLDNTEPRTVPTIHKLNSGKIIITPPQYTGIEAFETIDYNLNIVEGSQVSWQLIFSDPESKYFYSSSSENNILLQKNKNIFSIERQVSQSILYYFSYQDMDNETQLDGVYTISIIRDKSPKIKIIKPNRSLLEIAKNADSNFTLEVEISDDYGVSDISILASVAKGSGEAVKFRDKVFKFSQKIVKTKQKYSKKWSLLELGMEPGDEVYFSVVVKDNKQPKNQLSKSSSIIVRWLDDEDIELAAEGIQIRFVPEYFRSQRQIIIETEQLIEDRNDLSVEEFLEISSDLGHSQSDLKQKYGQYLGDEFGEEPGEQFGLADGYHGGESVAAGEASAGMKIKNNQKHSASDNKENQYSTDSSEPSPNSEIAHMHETIDSFESKPMVDRSGAIELIQQFSHDHDTTEVGPMSARDPKSWMKMAVSDMWQAELHLMLAEPKQALPFEYSAYKYLKLARQAKRIYAKRLGFEPPPVTEERRLSGELLNILQQDLSYTPSKNNQSDRRLFELAYQILNQEADNSNQDSTKEVTSLLIDNEIEVFSQLSARLLILSEKRPVLLTYAAIAERIAIGKTLPLQHCENCELKLIKKLWQLLPSSISTANVTSSLHGLKNSQAMQYINEQMRIQKKATMQQKINISSENKPADVKESLEQ